MVVPGSSLQTESPLAMPCLVWFPQEDFQRGCWGLGHPTPLGKRGDWLAAILGQTAFLVLPWRERESTCLWVRSGRQTSRCLVFVSLSKAVLGSLPIGAVGEVFVALQKTAQTFCTLISLPLYHKGNIHCLPSWKTSEKRRLLKASSYIKIPWFKHKTRTAPSTPDISLVWMTKNL